VPETRQALLLTDLEGTIRMASAAAARLFGLEPGEAEGRALQTLCGAPSPSVFEAIFADLRGGASGVARLGVTLPAPGGAGAEADLAMTVQPDGSGFMVTVTPAAPATSPGTATQAADAVLESAISDAALIVRDGVIVEAAEGLSALVGLEGGSLAGWRVAHLVAAEDLLPFVHLMRAVQSGDRASAEFGLHLLRARRTPPLEVAARARRVLHAGRPAVLLGLRDISRTLGSARRVTDRLEHLDAALAAAADAVLVLGPAEAGSPLILASRSVERLFGVEVASLTGHPFDAVWERLAPRHADPEGEERTLRAMLAEPRTMRVDTVRLAGDEQRVLERSMAPMTGPEGEVTGTICAFRDVTTRVRNDEEMRRSAEEARRAREELERLHEELRLANEGLERRMTRMQRLNDDLRVLDGMKTDLLANVSHELQTPLVSIKGFTEMILKGQLGGVTPEQQQGLELALRNVDRLIGMIENLMAFARSQGPETAPKLAVFPLEEAVGEAVQTVRETAARRGITVTIDLPAGGVKVRADRDGVVQVLLNLIGNAVKYNRDGGSVTVHATAGRRGNTRVEVRDTGIGIPRADLDKVFERSYRASNAPEDVAGTGIGLALVRDILRRHGAVIRVESEEGKGSVFSFTLPLETPSHDDGPPPRRAAPRPRRRR